MTRYGPMLAAIRTHMYNILFENYHDLIMDLPNHNL